MYKFWERIRGDDSNREIRSIKRVVGILHGHSLTIGAPLTSLPRVVPNGGDAFIDKLVRDIPNMWGMHLGLRSGQLLLQVYCLVNHRKTSGTESALLICFGEEEDTFQSAKTGHEWLQVELPGMFGWQSTDGSVPVLLHVCAYK